MIVIVYTDEDEEERMNLYIFILSQAIFNSLQAGYSHSSRTPPGNITLII